MKPIAIGLLLLSGCSTSFDEAEGALRSAGHVDIRVGDRALFGCGDEDMMGRHFTAKSANGQDAKGVVCCGVLKGCTVRYAR